MGFVYFTRSLYFFYALLALASPVTAAILQNYTISLPTGSSDHGKPGLLCTPTRPLDVLTFYLLNYVAHAATVLTRPGERADDYLVSVIGSLLFPALGLYRGIEAIFCGAVFVKRDDLRKAAASGALCMVVRGEDWRPHDGDSVSNAVLKRGERVQVENAEASEDLQGDVKEKMEVHLIPYSPPYLFSKFGCPVYVHRRIIHGAYSLPPGYRFAVLPHDALLEPPLTNSTTQQPTIEVSATYSIVKALVALAQSVYGLTTLYRARGDQIDQFGYAAFGLTVAPYAIMSVVNLIGNICWPEYPSMYMIESSIMEEARRRDGIFEGAVGRVKEDSNMSICSCGYANGEDVVDLRFGAGANGEVAAHFGITTPPNLVSHAPELKLDDEKTLGPTVSTIKMQDTLSRISTTTSVISHIYSIAALPEDLNYRFTDSSALLLIPCHTPIARLYTSPDVLPHRHSISAITLRRTWPLQRHYRWNISFSLSRQTTIARRWQVSKHLLTATIALAPLLVVGLMSHWRVGSIPAKESSTWRAFTVQWICLGTGTGLWFILDQEGKDGMSSTRAQLGPLLRFVMYVISAAPAVGGYIVVGQMLVRYGVCMWVGD